MEYTLIIATCAVRLAAAWLAYRLSRRTREKRFVTVAFVLGVTATFPLFELVERVSAEGFIDKILPQLAGGLAVLLTALILVRTLQDLTRSRDEVRRANDGLEQRVEERTAELRELNRELAGEIAERKKVEEALRGSEAALRRGESELRKLAGRLIAAQEEERRRLARELHDDLSQTLAALALELAALKRKPAADRERLRAGLSAAEARVNKLADDVHDLSRLLHPSILDDLGLTAAIRAECERFSEREGVPVLFEAADVPPELPDPAALTLYRIVQEGLRNISKHAAAESAEVRLEGADCEIRLTIEDTGRGFEPDSLGEKAGLGLVSMSERVKLIEGELKVDSAPGRGVRIRVHVPVPRRACGTATADSLAG